eukprot:TRINITY_DN5804_c0_g2_i3.p2 TRINITY_DN5804_c0_g2~~TRINITY_DN5804_c0_g2_i3.p2  ORF type:complete len:178 (-),score=0.23 TRINITY_DN5804_c0_g2_i3:794-1327(-)
MSTKQVKCCFTKNKKIKKKGEKIYFIKKYVRMNMFKEYTCCACERYFSWVKFRFGQSAFNKQTQNKKKCRISMRDIEKKKGYFMNLEVNLFLDLTLHPCFFILSFLWEKPVSPFYLVVSVNMFHNFQSRVITIYVPLKDFLKGVLNLQNSNNQRVSFCQIGSCFQVILNHIFLDNYL